MSNVDVWILHFEWEDGHSANVYPTEAAARKHVYSIVQDNWSYAAGDDHPIPEDMETAIALYFAAVEGIESYRIEQHTMKVPDPLPSAQGDVIDLTDEEVAAIRCLTRTLGSTNVVGDKLELPLAVASATLDSIYEKLA